MQFEHTVITNASPDAIWDLWANVSRWPEWDTELQTAELDGPFELGATGRLQPQKGPQSAFVISQLEAGRSYTFTTRLFFSRLDVYRFLAQRDDQTVFTHRVSFRGPLGFIFGRLLGPGFKCALPSVMKQLARLAEAAETRSEVF